MTLGPNDLNLISEIYLQRTRRALIDGDFALFAACFRLPLIVTTLTRERVIGSGADLRAHFAAVRRDHAAIGAKDIVRRCLDVTPRDCRTIAAVHETILVSDSDVLRGPYLTLSLIERVSDHWLIAACDYGVAGAGAAALTAAA